MVLSELKKRHQKIYESLDHEPTAKRKTPWHKKEEKEEQQKIYQRYFAKQISMVESLSLPELRQHLLEKHNIDENELGRDEANTKLEKILSKLDTQEEKKAMQQDQPNVKLRIPRDHPLASTGLYLYEVRMERQQKLITTCVKTGRPKKSDNQDFDISQVWCP